MSEHEKKSFYSRFLVFQFFFSWKFPVFFFLLVIVIPVEQKTKALSFVFLFPTPFFMKHLPVTRQERWKCLSKFWPKHALFPLNPCVTTWDCEFVHFCRQLLLRKHCRKRHYKNARHTGWRFIQTHCTPDWTRRKQISISHLPGHLDKIVLTPRKLNVLFFQQFFSWFGFDKHQESRALKNPRVNHKCSFTPNTVCDLVVHTKTCQSATMPPINTILFAYFLCEI